MSYENAIEAIKKEVEIKLRELEGLYIAANQLCKLDNIPPLYELGKHDKEAVQDRTLQGDEYYGKPLATVITEILQKKKSPAIIDEILARMKEGGYIFEVKEPLLAVSISMGKNKKFTKLPNEKWGLTDWYPNVKEKKQVINEVAANAEDSVVVKTVEQTKRRGRPPKTLVQSETKEKGEEPKE
jgi:DNA-directed RNA polymerase delta subunit